MIRTDVWKFWAAWFFVCTIWYAGLAGVYFDIGNKIGVWLDRRRALRILSHAKIHVIAGREPGTSRYDSDAYDAAILISGLLWQVYEESGKSLWRVS